MRAKTHSISFRRIWRGRRSEFPGWQAVRMYCFPGPRSLWYRKIRGEKHGYSDTDGFFYVVYHYKRILTGFVDCHVHISSGFGVPYSRQMVSHPTKNLHCSYVLVPGVIQNCFPGFQCRSIRVFTDRRIKRRIQQRHALNGYSVVLLRRKCLCGKVQA